jgi:hypothetical protein
MAALAHLGVGLAAKRIAPAIPAGYLVFGAYALDFLWFGFFAGIPSHLCALAATDKHPPPPLASPSAKKMMSRPYGATISPTVG